MKTLVVLISIVVCSLPALALTVGEELPKTQFETQFGKTFEFTEKTRWILFVSEKETASALTKTITATNKKYDESGVAFVSDISKMPKFVSKMFAIPKMKDYPFTMVLDLDGESTKNWPREKSKITLIELEGKKIKSIQFLNQNSELSNFISAIKL